MNAENVLIVSVEEIENINEKITDLKEEQKAVYIELKNNGFDCSIVRKIVKERQRTEEEVMEEQQLIEVYKKAINSSEPA